MKRFFYLILYLLPLLAGTCKKDETECHHYIHIKNNQCNKVIAAISLINPDKKCRLDGQTVNSGAVYDYRPFNHCIENSLTNGAIQEYT